MIVVTGATGKLGKLIVEELASRMPPEEIGVSVRDPKKAAGSSAAWYSRPSWRFRSAGHTYSCLRGSVPAVDGVLQCACVWWRPAGSTSRCDCGGKGRWGKENRLHKSNRIK